MKKAMSKVTVIFETRSFAVFVDCEKPEFAFDNIAAMLRQFAETRTCDMKSELCVITGDSTT